jgi:serine/threonine protein kinase
LLGRAISHYVIVRQLGHGGMGVVYEAEDLRLGRHVALKLLPEGAPDQQKLERLYLEARAAAQLNHPNICTIYEVDQADGHPFIAMELLEGVSLDRLIWDPFSPDTLVDLAIQIAGALNAAHAKGIIHRDIKPANIFITPQNQIKILDFGLAKLALASQQLMTTGYSDSLTSSGTVMGTVAYMSPEQARGDELDARSDLFSLGSTLYHMATGRLPFEGKTSAIVFHAILGVSPKPLLERKPHLPPKLAEIIERLLEKDPSLRYQSAADLRSDLKRLQREMMGLSTTSGTHNPAATAARAHKRRQYAFWTSTLMLAIIVAAGGWWWMRPVRVPFSSYSISQLTQSGDLVLVAASPDGRYLASVRNEAGKQSLRLRSVPTQSDTIVLPGANVRFMALRFSPDGDYLYFVQEASPGIGDLFRAPIFGGTPQRLVHGVQSNVTFSPDGTQIAFVRDHVVHGASRHDIIVSERDGRNERELRSSDKDMWLGVAWSPDGKKIVAPAFTPQSPLAGLVALDVKSGNVRPLFNSDRISIVDAVWTEDGRDLLALYKTRETGLAKLQIADIRYPSGAFTEITRDIDSYSSLSLSGNSRTLAAVLYKEGFELETTTYGKGVVPYTRVLQPRTGSKFLAWTNSGDLLLAEGSRVFRVGANASPSVLIEDDKEKTLSNAFSCEPEKYIVFTSIDNEKRSSVWRMNQSGGGFRQLTQGPDDMAQFCSADGKFVYFLDETTNTLARIGIDGGELRRLEGPTENSIASPSPDGKLFARFATVEGKQRIVISDAETGKVKRVLDPDPRVANVVHAPRFTPNGRAIAYVVHNEGVDNLWAQPLDGLGGKMLTSFNTEQIRDFAFSPDGAQIALLRGHYDSDVVLLRDTPK